MFVSANMLILIFYFSGLDYGPSQPKEPQQQVQIFIAYFLATQLSMRLFSLG